MSKTIAENRTIPSVLVVDDEDSVLYTIEAVLKKQHYRIQKASSAEEAIKKFKNDYFDLVITDLTMSGASGIDLLEQVLAINSDTLVILITAYGSETLAVEAMKKGAYDYLPKP
ncbi:MAG: sigma-54-dependent Fis family transcriptional regulator, partial [Candidatus Gerdarchaeota archaeon]